MSRKSRANKASLQQALAPVEAPEQALAPVEAPEQTAPQPEPMPETPVEAVFDEITANCPIIVRADRPKAGSGKSVIAAMYKKLHTLDALAETISLTVHGNDVSAKMVDVSLFDQLCVRNDINPTRWAHLNVGMRVMALTNTLRNRAKNDQPVWLTLDDETEEAADEPATEQAA